MRIASTATLPPEVVRAVVTFAARLMEVESWLREVRVTSCSGTFRGRCWGPPAQRVLLRVGHADKFPAARRAYRLGAPEYGLADAVEALAALAGHEFGHALQFRAGRARQSEVECERHALWVLTEFRARRGELVGAAEERARSWLARQEELARAREARAAARREEAPGLLVAGLEEKVREWRARERRAATWRSKYERRLARARKSLPTPNDGGSP